MLVLMLSEAIHEIDLNKISAMLPFCLPFNGHFIDLENIYICKSYFFFHYILSEKLDPCTRIFYLFLFFSIFYI